MQLKKYILPLLILSNTSYAFDLEDYATTFRATRDALLKSQNELALAKDAYDDFLNLLSANCKQVEDNFDVSKNISGLMSGKCNRDGEDPDPSGGMLAPEGKKKLGDVLARILELTPSFVDHSQVSIVSGGGGDLVNTLTAKRNELQQIRDSEIDSSTVTVSNKSGCIRKDTSIMKSGVTDEDLASSYLQKRNALRWALNELKRATPAAIAAKKAYNAANSVYLRSLSCAKPISSMDRLRYDPFLPLNPQEHDNKVLLSQVNPEVQPTPEPTPTPDPASGKIIFVTSQSYAGNLGGITGADQKCNDDPSKPNGSTYKAMITDGMNRRNTTYYWNWNEYPGQADWVFQPGMPYFRADGSFFATANSNGDLIPAEGLMPNDWIPVWTGIGTSNTNTLPWINCNGWTTSEMFDFITTPSGMTWRIEGADTNVSNAGNNYNFYNGGTSGCDQQKRLYCVEQ